MTRGGGVGARRRRLLLAAGVGVVLLCGCTASPAPDAGQSSSAGSAGAPRDGDAAPLPVLTLPADASDGPDLRVGTYSHVGDRPDLLRYGSFAADDDGCLVFLEEEQAGVTTSPLALAVPEGTQVAAEGALQIPVRQVNSDPDSTVTVRVGEDVQGGGAELSVDQARSEEYAVTLPEGCYPDSSMEVFLFEASEPRER